MDTGDLLFRTNEIFQKLFLPGKRNYQECNILKLRVLEVMLINSPLKKKTAEVNELCLFCDIYLLNFCHYKSGF